MAIDDLLDEHEQSEKVRTWLHDNGIGLIGGVALGLAMMGGWQWWQKRQNSQQLRAAEQYQATLNSIQSKDLKQAASRLGGQQGIYADLAALDLAKAQLQAGQRNAAMATLRQARPGDPALAAVVRQRQARLLIDAGKADAALALLSADGADANAREIRGDAQFALGKGEQARAEYARALTQLEVGAPQRRLVELKLSQVGGVPAQPEAQP